MEPILPAPVQQNNGPDSSGSQSSNLGIPTGGAVNDDSFDVGNQSRVFSPSVAADANIVGATDQPDGSSIKNEANRVVAPAIADDVDVIEKEWVNRAKDIVNATKDNPYEQEKEVGKLQADYMIKRYGREIKTGH